VVVLPLLSECAIEWAWLNRVFRIRSQHIEDQETLYIIIYGIVLLYEWINAVIFTRYIGSITIAPALLILIVKVPDIPSILAWSGLFYESDCVPRDKRGVP
jgi:hypothetical protein